MDRYYKCGLKNLPCTQQNAGILLITDEPNEDMNELVKILFEPTPHDKNLVISCLNCDEVYPNLYISDGIIAKNKKFVKSKGITHIVNTAEGSTKFGMVDTNEEYYKDVGIKYMGLQLLDLPTTSISMYFTDVCNFIDEGMNSGGKVLVHCLMGISRSSTFVIAYLMIKKGYSLRDAIVEVKKHRNVRPNVGFLNQLINLNEQLKSA